MPFSAYVSPKQAIGYGHDVVVSALALALAHALLDTSAPTALIALQAGAIAVMATFVYPLVGLNRGAWRYASIHDLIAIVGGVTLLVALVGGLTYVAAGPAADVRLYAVFWLLAVIVLAAPRLLYRYMRMKFFAAPRGEAGRPAVQVLLYGFGDQADSFIRAARRERRSRYEIVGIIDDRSKNRHRSLHQVRVVGPLSELADYMAIAAMRGIEPERLILTEWPLPPEDATRIVRTASDLGLAVERLPGIESMTLGGGAAEPKPIRLEDLVGRTTAHLDTRRIADLVHGRTALVTGGGGWIGTELVRQITAFGAARVIVADNSEHKLYELEQAMRGSDRAARIVPVIADVRDEGRVRALFEEWRPELVFHAAALKHVPIVEANPVEAAATNVIGTRNVADAAARFGALAFVMISTDKAVEPANVLGATKRAAETYCRALDLVSERARFLTVRFGNVLGSTGSVVPLFERQLRRGGPLTVTHPEVERYFMATSEAVELVLQASAHGLSEREERGAVFVLDMGRPVKIAEIARNLIRMRGLRPDIDIEIAFTGLRPGEKLHEALFDEGEEVMDSGAEGVLLARSPADSLPSIQRKLAELSVAVDTGDADGVLTSLSSIVPGYRRKPPGEGDIISLEDARRRIQKGA